jgi:hypothetical protein
MLRGSGRPAFAYGSLSVKAAPCSGRVNHVSRVFVGGNSVGDGSPRSISFVELAEPQIQLQPDLTVAEATRPLANGWADENIIPSLRNTRRKPGAELHHTVPNPDP